MAREEPPAKKKVKADPHRIMAWVDSTLERPAPQLLFGILLLVALTALLSPRLWRSERVVTRLQKGQLAEGNIKAVRTFSYLPPSQKVEEQRRMAGAVVLPVFDHQEGLGEDLSRRIKQAFLVLGPADSGVRVDSTADTPRRTGRLTQEQKEALQEQQLSELARREERRKQFSTALGFEVDVKDFELLLRVQSQREVRGILLALVVEEALGNLVVAHREDVIQLRKKSIIVRHLVGERLSASGEEKVSNLGRIKDLAQVAAEVQTKADVHAAKLTQPLARVVVRMAQGLIQPNLTFNSVETNQRVEEARKGISNTAVTFVKGQVIVRDGDPITSEHLRILEAMEPREKPLSRFQVPIGVGIIVMLLLAVMVRFSRRDFLRFYFRPRDLLAMAVLLLGLVALVKSVVTLGGGYARGKDLPEFLFAIPLACGAMLARMLISAEAAAVFATLLAFISGIVVDQNLGLMVFYFLTGLMASSGVSQVQSRSTILRAGLWAGLVGAGALLAFRMYQEVLFSVDTLYGVLAAVAGGVLTAFMTLALLPAMEWLFAYTTDVTLLELANLNHPLLRDLILRAPGTYHHSMVVGSLSEAACEAIKANGLLARVASYYHDIGKTRNAEYFAENYRTQDSPHNRLKPSMSALIIRSHVKDTVEMLRQHGVPELVIDTATQHHGKTLIEYFFHKAKEQAKEQKETHEEVLEEDYRYPGPKPQSREAGIIMLADGVEATARSLTEPTEDRLQGVVQRIINAKFTDGQLDHCDLTLRDLHNIAKSFLQVLRGIYHQRPSYPWQQKRDEPRHETGKLKQVSTTTGPVEKAKQEDGKGDKADRDKANRDKADRDKAERDRANRDKADRDKAERDKAEKEKTEKEKAEKDRGDKGKPRDVKKAPERPDGKRKKGGKGKGAAEEEREDKGQRSHAGSPAARQDHQGHQADEEDETGDDTGDHVAGEGASPAGAEPGVAQEVTTESSTDLRRLGL